MKPLKVKIFIFSVFLGLTLLACGSSKEGCPVNDDAHVKMDRSGQLPTKGGKSNLFSKKMRKKM